MPTKWVPAETLLIHRGVVIYRVYRHDDIEQGCRDYHYGWHQDCSEIEDSFDVRNLSNPNGHDVNTEDGQAAIIRDAIDAGVLTQDGVVMPENVDS